MTSPFAFIDLPQARSVRKPRASGLTMMVDFGLPYGQVNDVLDMAGDYIDFGKIAVGTARLYDLAYLRRKLSLYRLHKVRAFIGGQFMEYVYAVHGEAMLPRYLDEAKRVGFQVIEISDNCVPLNRKERMSQIRLARSHGLAVFGEVGSKDMKNDARKLVSQAEDCFEAGAELVLVEAAELIEDGKPKMKLINGIRRGLDMDKVLIELPGPWISGVTLAAVEDMKKFLVSELGPDVNLANVAPQDIMETEALRVGLGVVGPKVRGSVARLKARASTLHEQRETKVSLRNLLSLEDPNSRYVDDDDELTVIPPKPRANRKKQRKGK